jgi:hypothetical protein
MISNTGIAWLCSGSGPVPFSSQSVVTPKKSAKDTAISDPGHTFPNSYLLYIDSTITYGTIGGNFGGFDLGIHYLTGAQVIVNKAKSTKIPAVTVGYTLPDGLNISAGYAEIFKLLMIIKCTSFSFGKSSIRMKSFFSTGSRREISIFLMKMATILLGGVVNMVHWMVTRGLKGIVPSLFII